MKTRRAEAKWIEKEKRWRIRVYKNKVSKTFYSSNPATKGKRDVEKKADLWLSSGEYGDIRFAALWELFLRQCKETTGTSNYKKHEQIGRIWLSPNVSIRNMCEITPFMWQSCINAGYKSGLSKKSCMNIRDSIIAAIKFAKNMSLPIEIPELTIPKNAPTKERNVLQPDSLNLLFSKNTITRKLNQYKAFEIVPHYIYAWRFLVVTGLRCGELCGLVHEDIKNNTVSIKRSYNCFDEETRGKNDNARRTFALSNIAQQVLRDQSAMLKKSGIVSPWVFPAEDGSRARSRKLYRDWEYCRSQFGTSCSLHELRHTMISIAKISVPDSLLKPLVGHSKSMDTQGIYGHEIDGDAQLTAELLDSAFDRLLKQKK